MGMALWIRLVGEGSNGLSRGQACRIRPCPATDGALHLAAQFDSDFGICVFPASSTDAQLGRDPTTYKDGEGEP